MGQSLLAGDCALSLPAGRPILNLLRAAPLALTYKTIADELSGPCRLGVWRHGVLGPSLFFA